MDALEAARLEVVTKPWGWELVIKLDHGTLLKLIHVGTGQRTSLQRHEHKEEVIMALQGDGGVQDEDGDCLAHETETVRIPVGLVHRSAGHTLLLEVSTNYPEDVVRIQDDFGRP